MNCPHSNAQTHVSDSLLSYFDRQQGKLLRAWRRSVDHHDRGGIHDYRVCVKRLKALFNLAAAVNPDFSAKKRFRRFRKLFKSSAALRDIHIQIALAKNLCSLQGFPREEYEFFLQSEERAAAESFDRFAETFEEEKLAGRKKKLAAALEGIGDDDAVKRALSYFRTLASGLVAKVQDPGRKESDLHHFRMLMKETHYTCEIIRTFPAGFEEADAFISNLKKVHHALGKWHDLELLHACVKRFAAIRPDIEEERFEPAIKRIARKKAGYFRSFERAWRGFLTVFQSSMVF
jgi:CHAD domain-containing protein